MPSFTLMYFSVTKWNDGLRGSRLTKSERIQMNKNIWAVVTIQKEDGHEFNGIFITSNHQTLREFASSVSPYKVICSKYKSEKEARDFYFEICDGYMNIDPLRVMEQYGESSVLNIH